MVWLIITCVLILDRLSKYYISHNFKYLESVVVIPKFFYLTYVKNYGAAFGILQNKRLFFILVGLMVIGFFLYFYRHLLVDWLNIVISGLVIGGVLGNLIDRIFLGYVVDFIDFRVWPVFNIADSAMVVGMVLLGWRILFGKEDIFQLSVQNLTDSKLEGDEPIE